MISSLPANHYRHVLFTHTHTHIASGDWGQMLSQFLKGFPWLDMLEMTFWFTGGREEGKGVETRNTEVEGGFFFPERGQE